MAIHKLSAVPVGSSVVAVDSQTPVTENDLQVIYRRLLGLGFVPGAQLKVLHKAPFGDPIAVEVDGLTWGLSLKEASLIFVETENP